MLNVIQGQRIRIAHEREMNEVVVSVPLRGARIELDVDEWFELVALVHGAKAVADFNGTYGPDDGGL